MKLSTQQAAFLYLLLFNIGEAGDEKYNNLENEANRLLREGGYPADDIIFDNEGMAMIQWPDGFDQEEWFLKETHSDPDGDFNDAWNESTPIGHELSLAFDFAPDKCDLLGYLLNHKAASWNQ